jgi:hypothetical protein
VLPPDEVRFEVRTKPVSAAAPSTNEPAQTAASVQVAPAAAGRRGRSKGGIPDVPEVDIDVSTIAPDILAAIGMPLAREIAKWRDAWNSGRASKSFVLVEAGLGIRLQFVVSSAGLDINKIVEPLKANGWLEMRQAGNRSLPVHRLAFADAEDTGYLLKRAFVKRCGFTLHV